MTVMDNIKKSKIKKRRNKRGFTLIEVVIAMGILVLLAALVIGALIIARKQSATMQLKNDAKNIRDLLEAYYAKNQSYPNPGNSRMNAYEFFASTSIPDNIAKKPNPPSLHQLSDLLPASSYPKPPVPGDGSTGLICYSSGGSEYWFWIITKEERDAGHKCGNNCTDNNICGFTAASAESKIHCPKYGTLANGCTDEYKY